MKSDKKSLVFIAAFAIPPLCVALIFAWLLISLGIHNVTEYKFTKNCYYSNEEDMNKLCSGFKELYSAGMYRADLDGDTGTLELSYYTEEREYYSETIDFSDTYCTDILNNLSRQYRAHSEYPVFASIEAYYDDNGNMLLIMQAEKSALKKKKTGDPESPSIRCNYLIYIDSEYSGHGSPFIIDNPGVERDPYSFTDNWYTWSKDLYLG